MTKLADELERLAKAIRTAIEYMPYLDRQKEDDDGDYLPLTLREFYEETWQGSYADELFQDVENVIITALRQPVADEAQRLQDHMEQHHGVCLQASQWDAAITALRQPDAVPGDLVEERARKICNQFKIDPDEIIDEYGPVYQWCIPAYHIGEAIQSLTAERDAALTMVADLASELESELDAKGIYDTPRKMVRNRQTVVQARALLERYETLAQEIEAQGGKKDKDDG